LCGFLGMRRGTRCPFRLHGGYAETRQSVAVDGGGTNRSSPPGRRPCREARGGLPLGLSRFGIPFAVDGCLFWTSIRRLPPFGPVAGAEDNDCPEALLAAVGAAPAKRVVSDAVSVVEEERPFQAFFSAHSRHIFHAPIFRLSGVMAW